MKFSELQQQLKKEFGIDHLSDIARELGVSPQAVSNWKARDRVPYKYVLKVRKQLEESDNQVSDQSANNDSYTNQLIPQNSYTPYFEEETISLTDILLVLARQLKIIIITPSIICTITIIYALFFTSPIYESSAKIMSSSGGGDVSQAAGLAAQFGISLPTGQSEPEWAYVDIVKSRTLARAMLQRKFDTEKYGPQKPLLQILTYGDDEPEFGLDTLIKQGVESVINMIDVQQNKSFYDLTISAPEPLFARDFAKVLIEELDAHQRNYNKTKTSETRQFIEERIIDTENELQAAEEALKNFRDHNRRIENSPALLLEQQRFSREVAVLTGVFTTLKQQLETTKIAEVKDTDYVVVLDPPEAPLDRASPNRRLMVILAGFIGIAIGVLIAFIMDYLDSNKVEEKEELNEAKSIFLVNLRALSNIRGLFRFK